MNKITIVCLTYRRQLFIKRQLLYFADKPIDIIFADDSKKDFYPAKKGKIGKLNWRYFRINKKSSIYERWFKASKLIKTKYVCMLDDTDFMPYTTLNKAKTFLEKNKSYKAIGGLRFTISKEKKNNLFNLENKFKDIENYKNYSKEKNLNYIFSKQLTRNIFYSLVDASVFKDAIKIIYDFKNTSWGVSSELILTSMIILKCKFKFFMKPFVISTTHRSVDLKTQNRVKSKKKIVSTKDWYHLRPQESKQVINLISNKFNNKLKEKTIKAISKAFLIHKIDSETCYSTKHSFISYILKRKFKFNFTLPFVERIYRKLFYPKKQINEIFNLYHSFLKPDDLKEFKKIITYTNYFPEGVKTFPFKKELIKKVE